MHQAEENYYSYGDGIMTKYANGNSKKVVINAINGLKDVISYTCCLLAKKMHQNEFNPASNDEHIIKSLQIKTTR